MYTSSNSPLPNNSAMDSGPVIDTACVDAIAEASRTGRERVYANLPTPASFWPLAPGLAVDAAQIIPQTEDGRRAVLIGVGVPPSPDEPTLAELLAGAPVVSSLNGAPGVGLSTAQSGLMPAAAPIKTIGGLWASPKPFVSNGIGGQRGLVAQITRPMLARGAGMGPQCSAPVPPPPMQALPSFPPAPVVPAPTVPPPAPTRKGTVHVVASPSANYPNHVTAIDAPAPIGPTVQFENLVEAQQFFNSQGYDVVGPGSSGVSGYSPAWGDAWQSSAGPSSVSSTNGNSWLWWALGGIGALALLHKQRRGRRAK